MAAGRNGRNGRTLLGAHTRKILQQHRQIWQRGFVMAICQTGTYRVKPESVAKVKRAIEEFVGYLQANEPGTQMYLAWQEKDDPTRFVHLFIFADAAAHARHGQSEAVKRFESIYAPELVGGDVVFTDYEMIGGKR
jgi:quinol monooxygenase YgiN